MRRSPRRSSRLGSAGTSVAIIAVDIGIASVAWTTDLRMRCGEAIGTSPSNVLVNYNHTHSAPVACAASSPP